MYCTVAMDRTDVLKEKNTPVENRLICFASSQKISIALPQRWFGFNPSPPFAHVFSFKNWGFENPSPFEFPITLLGVSMVFFWIS